MNDRPLVSIVIPAYNVARYIVKCVESALTQTYPNIEVVIVNDGSTDETPQLIQKHYSHHPRVRYFNQPNSGVSAARNRGVMEARGEYVHFLDADEFIMPSKVEKSIALIRPGIEVVYGPGMPVMPDTETMIDFQTPPLPSGDVFCEWLTGTMSGGTYGVTSSFMARRQLVIDVGLFDVTQSAAEDWDLWLRLATRCSFAALGEVLVHYVRREDGLHHNRLKMAQGRLYTIQKARHYPGRERCLDDKAYDRLEAGRWQVVAIRLWEAGRRSEAREAFRQAIRLHPSRVRHFYKWATYLFPVGITGIVDRLKRKRS